MRKIFCLFLALALAGTSITLSFAQASNKSIPIPTDSMADLCPQSKTLFGVLIMLMLIFAFTLLVIREIIEQFAKGNKTLVCLSPKIRALAIICFAIAVIGIIVYMAFPFILNMLVGPTVYNPCSYQPLPECNNSRGCITQAMDPL